MTPAPSVPVPASDSRADQQESLVENVLSCDFQHESADSDHLLPLEMDDFNSVGDETPRASTTPHARPRVRLLYIDEGVRQRFCSNAQYLLQTALKDPLADSTSAQLARKALRYRNIMSRTEEIDLHDPTFDVSAFFGIKWQRSDSLTDD